MKEGNMSEVNHQAISTADREITVTRVFSAPRELVFAMWTDPKHLANWFGPRGFTTNTHEMEVRPGGVWRHTMRGPDGTEYPNQIIYREVVKPERLVYSHVSPPPFQMTVSFVAEGNQTRLTARMLFETAALRDHTIRQFGAEEGLQQTLQRLAEQLAKASHDHAPRAPVIPYLTLRDADRSFKRALDAGASVVMPLDNMFWGARYGKLKDPFGHIWSIGGPVKK
jgi:uncharacterized protein YndB with AHSA1/START domain